jgi:large subunit ribosomal protein L21
MTLAVIAVNGKQYLVKPGSRLTLDRLNDPVGSAVAFPALLRMKDDTVEIGRPLLTDPATGKITGQGRARKLTVIKFKRKVRYRRKVGHRQPITTVEITRV